MSNSIQQLTTQHQNGFYNASVDPAFQNIVKSKPAFLIWRVENLLLNAVPKDSYGIFFKGDTYLIYHSSESPNKVMIQHVHLWIGSESTTDEQGVGAYKMVELDDYLGGMPIQHRECQSHESERFLSYFKYRGGVRYLNGGVASGFHHYEKRLEPRLFQVKGKRNVRLSELASIEWPSLNRNDSFVIDLCTTIFVWNGKNANKIERLQAANKARQFRDERNGSLNIVLVDDGEEKDLGKDELKLFEAKFPLKDKVTKLKNESNSINPHDDLKFERESAGYLKLYRCSDARDDEDGTVKIKIIEQKTGPLYREDLSSDDSFIIDNGKAGIWVWIGRRSNQKERQEAMRNALGFLQAKGFDEKQQNSIKVTRVIEGGEPVEFRALFNRWCDSNELKAMNGSGVSSGGSGGGGSVGVGLGVGGNSGKTLNSIAKTVQTKFDAELLHSNPQLAAESQLVDDARGTKQIWFVHNFDIHKLNEAKYGEFHSADCYIVHYRYNVNKTEKDILYYWIGRKSSIDEQATAALKTIELDNKLFYGKATQVRVCEGKEPNHFMAIFDGKIVIYQGGKASGFRGGGGSGGADQTTDNYMLQVKSYGQFNIKAVQVEYRASSLNSNDVFIICHRHTTFYIWCGKGSTGDERQAAKSILLGQKKEPEMVIESQEKEEFWQALGGRQTYYSDKRNQHTSQTPIVRLFEISNSSGRINVSEIYQFNQDDLNSYDTMLLDAWDSIFLWIGTNSNKQEREEADRIAMEYLKTDPSLRGTNVPIYKIKQGQEPPIFTGFFVAWDSNALSKNETDYQSIKMDLQSKNQPHLFQQAVREKSYSNGGNGLKHSNPVDFNQCPKYSYEDLVKPADQLPENVINELKEVHLTDDDFQKIFKMNYAQFREKPLWKQKELKRSVRLF